MNGIRIKDMHPRGFLSFDLKDLLELVKHEINESMWLCEYVEATATFSPNVKELANNNELVSSRRLVCAAKNTHQVIDGVFRAVSDDIEWLRIEAIDSSYWEVYSLNGDVLSKIGKAFRDVEAIKS